MLRLAGHRPLLLGSTAKQDNSRLAFDLTNTDLGRGPQRLPHSSVHLSRTKVLWDGVCHERLVARSFAREPVRLILTLRFGPTSPMSSRCAACDARSAAVISLPLSASGRCCATPGWMA